MIVPVIWKSYNPETIGKTFWDQGMVKDIFTNNMWPYPINDLTFKHLDDFTKPMDGAVIILPARSNAEYIADLNKDISKLRWVVLFLTGDEENIFPIEMLKHGNILVYVMSPREGLYLSNHRVLGTGYPPQMHESLDNTEAKEKYFDWYFSGQVTHDRRKECATALRKLHDDPESKLFGSTMLTAGFTQGVDHPEYYESLANAKVAPCPSGPETPDTFRLFEALEAGCVPIADTRVTKGGFSDNYWQFFFGEEPPFPIIKDYADLPGYIEDQVKLYPANNNKVFAWWQSKKRDLVYQVKEDIEKLSGYKYENISGLNNSHDNITVIIPVSPIKSHPDTSILEQTIASVRHHLPHSEIFLTFDGVRAAQEDKRADYNEFIRRILWKCNHTYKNVLPILFDEHMHQTGMAKAVIDRIKTPLLLYVEQDTPLVIDESIDFPIASGLINNGTAHVVRFHHEGVIPQDHSHMVHGTISCSRYSPVGAGPINFIITSQWSQRPHLASVAFYRRILDTCFSENAKSFIEDKMHGVCSEAYRNDGMLGWENYKILIYADGDNIKRSYHTDGRAGELKYDSEQVF